MPTVNQIIKPGDRVRMNGKYKAGVQDRFREFEVLETGLNVWGDSLHQAQGLRHHRCRRCGEGEEMSKRSERILNAVIFAVLGTADLSMALENGRVISAIFGAAMFFCSGTQTVMAIVSDE